MTKPMTLPLILVVAVAENGVIGHDNRLLWRLKTDLRRFRDLTWGKPIIMGRKTFESIGRALPGRETVVLTRSDGFSGRGGSRGRQLGRGRRQGGRAGAGHGRRCDRGGRRRRDLCAGAPFRPKSLSDRGSCRSRGRYRVPRLRPAGHSARRPACHIRGAPTTSIPSSSSTSNGPERDRETPHEARSNQNVRTIPWRSSRVHVLPRLTNAPTIPNSRP